MSPKKELPWCLGGDHGISGEIYVVGPANIHDATPLDDYRDVRNAWPFDMFAPFGRAHFESHMPGLGNE